MTSSSAARLPPYADEFRPRWPGDPGGYTTAQMLEYRRAALEEAAQLLDREHEARKHLDNHVAFYARKIRALSIHIPPTCTDSDEK